MGKEEIRKKLIVKLKKFKKSIGSQYMILFGSYARGDFNKVSDVDMIIVDKKFQRKDVFKRSKGLWIEWHVKHKIGYPVDFICYTPDELNRLKHEVSIVSEALREGIEI